MLIVYGAVSLRALREFLQLRLNVNLAGRRSDIRRLAMIAADELCSGSKQAAAYAPVWEVLPTHVCLGVTKASDSIRESGNQERGRCLFSFLSDIGDAAGDVEDGLHSNRWHDSPTGNTCCGLQSDGQLPSDRVVGGGVAGAQQQGPCGMMVDVGPMAVRTGAWRQGSHTELVLFGKEDAANDFARRCLFVGPALDRSNNSSWLQEGQVRSDRTLGGENAGKSASVSGLGFPLPLRPAAMRCLGSEHCMACREMSGQRMYGKTIGTQAGLQHQL
ncbi:unnamed protein product [Symbiodinium sp. CCMP2592]|nr:unnamed protein product [Symbiodinium sp. CCMP2592]